MEEAFYERERAEAFGITLQEAVADIFRPSHGGDWLNPLEPGYFNNTEPGVKVMLSPGRWTECYTHSGEDGRTDHVIRNPLLYRHNQFFLHMNRSRLCFFGSAGRNRVSEFRPAPSFANDRCLCTLNIQECEDELVWNSALRRRCDDFKCRSKRKCSTCWGTVKMDLALEVSKDTYYLLRAYLVEPY